MKRVKALGGVWTEARFNKLKAAYEEAITMKVNPFIFEEQEMLVDFTKYLIEHLENEFRNG